MPPWITPGTQIPSTNVNRNLHYLQEREITTLIGLKALSLEQRRLLERVDGIIANRPADGTVTIEELLVFERPENIRFLSDRQKQQVKALWTFLETDVSDPIAPQESLQSLSAREQLIAPQLFASQVDKEKAFRIGLYNSGWFAGRYDLIDLAEMIQRGYDNDGKTQTISISDIEHAMAEPGPFTLHEVDLMREMIARFTASATTFDRTPTPGFGARIEVPTPGTVRTPLVYDGPATLSLLQTTSVRERRTIKGPGQPATGTTEVERRTTIEIAIPAGCTGVWITSTGRRMLTGTSQNPQAGTPAPFVAHDDVPQGDGLLEIWKDGRRIDTSRVTFPTLPTLSGIETLTFPVLGRELVANDVPLVASAIETRDERGETSVTFEYGTASIAPRSPIDQAVLRQLAPRMEIEPGLYQVGGAAHPMELTLFPSGAALLTIPGFRGSVTELTPMNRADGTLVLGGVMAVHDIWNNRSVRMLFTVSSEGHVSFSSADGQVASDGLLRNLSPAIDPVGG